MPNRLIKVGVVGGLFAAICCFTPVLVWVLSLIGLAGLISYLDDVLLPLLLLFVALIIVGFVQKDSSERNKT